VGDYARSVGQDAEERPDRDANETAHDKFLRAVALVEAGDYAAALPLFNEVVESSDTTPRGYDSCIANIAICSHHLGDHQTALTYTAMFLDSSASPTPDQRTALLEMFFASYKGQTGIAFHNPYNEYT
jgi:hypothetical protein